jgi:hypothetical protein
MTFRIFSGSVEGQFRFSSKQRLTRVSSDGTPIEFEGAVLNRIKKPGRRPRTLFSQRLTEAGYYLLESKVWVNGHAKRFRDYFLATSTAVDIRLLLSSSTIRVGQTLGSQLVALGFQGGSTGFGADVERFENGAWTTVLPAPRKAIKRPVVPASVGPCYKLDTENLSVGSYRATRGYFSGGVGTATAEFSIIP